MSFTLFIVVDGSSCLSITSNLDTNGNTTPTLPNNPKYQNRMHLKLKTLSLIPLVKVHNLKLVKLLGLEKEKLVVRLVGRGVKLKCVTVSLSAL